MNYLFKYRRNILVRLNAWLIAFCFFLIHSLDNAYGLDTVSFKELSPSNIQVSSKVDLTILPRRKILMVPHPRFTLQFYFDNKDIWGFILKREKNFGIVIHLCFFRTCEESPYDINQVIAMPQDPPPDKTFFSVKFPYGLKYKFQGMEFIPIN